MGGIISPCPMDLAISIILASIIALALGKDYKTYQRTLGTTLGYYHWPQRASNETVHWIDHASTLLSTKNKHRVVAMSCRHHWLK